MPLEAGFVLSDLKAGSSTPEALLDVVMLGGLERQRQKRNFIKNKYGDEVYSQLQSYKSFGDDGMGKPQELPEQFKKLKQAERAETAKGYGAEREIRNIKGYASGGIASLTRTTPPERGPQYRGLDYLRKHGRGY